jgi:hypothetical protein
MGRFAQISRRAAEGQIIKEKKMNQLFFEIQVYETIIESQFVICEGSIILGWQVRFLPGGTSCIK